jgi:hypothetical protein
MFQLYPVYRRRPLSCTEYLILIQSCYLFWCVLLLLYRLTCVCAVAFVVRGINRTCNWISRKYWRGVRGIWVLVGVHPIHAEVRSTSDFNPLKPNKAWRGEKGQGDSRTPHGLLPLLLYICCTCSYSPHTHTKSLHSLPLLLHQLGERLAKRCQNY